MAALVLLSVTTLSVFTYPTYRPHDLDSVALNTFRWLCYSSRQWQVGFRLRVWQS